MDLKDLKSIYFLGIGGIGMSAEARYFHSRGVQVAGYDKTPTPLTRQLSKEGVDIHYEEDISLLPEQVDLAVYTPAIPSDHKELAYFRQQNIPLKKRSEVLGMITAGLKCLAVAGTHGKTTTSTLIAHILRLSGLDCTAFLGGISKNYQTNLLLAPESEYIVVEADEFDRSFLHLNPYLGVITSADADHLDIYGSKEDLLDSFSQFTGNIRPEGILLIKEGLHVKVAKKPAANIYTYSLVSGTNFHARNIRIERGSYLFDFVTATEVIPNLSLGVPGLMNVENAVAALSVAYLLGVDNEAFRPALKSFRGVVRRFDYRINTETLVYIDDYAHHPEELRACIQAVRSLFPGKKVTGIFQPHLYSRTRDFADEFARSLELLDALILLDIYPARELPIEGVSSEMLLGKVRLENKKLCSRESLINELKAGQPEVLLTLGAGDIDQLVEPIEDLLLRKNINQQG